MEYTSVAELVKEAEKRGRRISGVVLSDQAAELELSEDAVYRRMEEMLRVMESSALRGPEEGLKSMSGLTGGDGRKLFTYAESGKSLLGERTARAAALAMGVTEYNAAMGKIVAAPTAGSCGILPGCLLEMCAEGAEHRDVVMSMFTAAGIGMVIAKQASISGAEGGCQAECGSAAAMAAAALTELKGGSPSMCAQAAAIALKNQMGLVCDPVAGLVEIPCIKRNAEGVVTAFCAADLALSGVCSYIPCDEVIGAMKQVGRALPSSLRETAEGGLAATPTGQKLKAQVFAGKKPGSA